MTTWLLLLATVGQAAEPETPALHVREVRTTTGRRLVCWDPPPADGSLDGPVDVRLRVNDDAAVLGAKVAPPDHGAGTHLG